MGCCTGRCLLITICVLQLITTVERQVFDFLGYMWAPIIGNFLQIIFVICGLIGTIQYRPKVVVVYSVWSLIWLGWNVFVICFYLEVGILSRESSILNIGTGNKSWWLDNGLGCTVTNMSWSDHSTPSQTSRLLPPEQFVKGCYLQYYYVEIIHAAVQCLFSLIGFCIGCFVVYVFTEEDDSSQPVHDELEYIKMRYRSPARSSFRDNKTYETLTTQASTYSSMDRGIDHPLYEDDSTDRNNLKSHSKERILKQDKKSKVKEASSPGYSPDLPWTGHSPGTPRGQKSKTPPQDYGFNSSSQPIIVGTPGQTVV